jgi:hypothetical protein
MRIIDQNDEQDRRVITVEFDSVDLMKLHRRTLARFHNVLHDMLNELYPEVDEDDKQEESQSHRST